MSLLILNEPRAREGQLDPDAARELDRRVVDRQETREVQNRLSGIRSGDWHLNHLAVSETDWQQNPFTVVTRAWAAAFRYLFTALWLTSLKNWFTSRRKDIQVLGWRGLSRTLQAQELERHLRELEFRFGRYHGDLGNDRPLTMFKTWQWVCGLLSTPGEGARRFAKRICGVIVLGLVVVLSCLILRQISNMPETPKPFTDQAFITLPKTLIYFRPHTADHKGGGGGGGGRKEKLQASRGDRLPIFKPNPNMISPMVVHVKNPRLAVEPELKSYKTFTPPPDNYKKQYGIKTSPQLVDSNGLGALGGIGAGSGGGIGDSTGLGLGPGLDGGFGGGRMGSGGRPGSYEEARPKHRLNVTLAGLTEPTIVVVFVALDVMGKVDFRKPVRIDRSDGAIYEQAVMEALHRAEFYPRRRNGNPEPVPQIRVELQFTPKFITKASN